MLRKDLVRTGIMHPFKERASALAGLLPAAVGAGPACLSALYIQSITIKVPSPEGHRLPKTWCKVAFMKSGSVFWASLRSSTGFACRIRRCFFCHVAEGPWWQGWMTKVYTRGQWGTVVEVTKMELDERFVYPPRNSVVQSAQAESEPCKAAVTELPLG